MAVQLDLKLSFSFFKNQSHFPEYVIPRKTLRPLHADLFFTQRCTNRCIQAALSLLLVSRVHPTLHLVAVKTGCSLSQSDPSGSGNSQQKMTKLNSNV